MGGILGTWIAANWFVLLQSVGIIGGLIFTAVSLRSDTHTRRISNLLTITNQHREIWSRLFDRPELARVLSESAGPAQSPITAVEALLIRRLILHLSSSYHAIKDGVFLSPEGVRKDIAWFFSLPLPKAVWRRWRDFQDRSFVAYVDGCLANAGEPRGDQAVSGQRDPQIAHRTHRRSILAERRV